MYVLISLPPINLSYTNCTDDEELVQLMCAITLCGKTIKWPCWTIRCNIYWGNNIITSPFQHTHSTCAPPGKQTHAQTQTHTHIHTHTHALTHKHRQTNRHTHKHTRTHTHTHTHTHTQTAHTNTHTNTPPCWLCQQLHAIHTVPIVWDYQVLALSRPYHHMRVYTWQGQH